MQLRLDPSRLSPPESFRRIAGRLEAEGLQAWAVGGSLRDTYVEQLGGAAEVVAADWDLATDAQPEEVISLFPRTVPVGVEHGTVAVLEGDDSYEVTTFRRDVETDGRHARVVFGTSIDEDLERRDFTANALAWRPHTGEIRDPMGGAEDIERGILRTVGDPEARFREDYLRVLRGFRFAGRFGWEVEPETDRALRDAVDGLPRLSAERVREELTKILRDPVPSAALDLYATAGALAHWYPEVAELASRREAWIFALNAADEGPADAPNLRLAQILVEVAGTPEGRAEAAESLLTRLRFSNADRRHVSRLVRLYLPFVGPTDSAAEHRRWLAEAGEDWEAIFALHLAAARALKWSTAPGPSPDDAERYIKATRERVQEEWKRRPPLTLADLELNGDDLIGLGVSPGPALRLLLEELLEQVIEDPDRNQSALLLEEAGRLIELGSLREA